MSEDKGDAGPERPPSAPPGGGLLGRRDVLKYGAAAVAAAGAGGLALRNFVEPPRMAAAASSADAIRNGKFAIDISGCPIASANIHSVHGGDFKMDLVETTTGPDPLYRTYAPGNAHYGNLTLRSRIGPQPSELRSWLDECRQGLNIRKDITAIVMDKDGEEARRWNFMQCFPVKWDPGDYSPRSTMAVERIDVVLEYMEQS